MLIVTMETIASKTIIEYLLYVVLLMKVYMYMYMYLSLIVMFHNFVELFHGLRK